MDETTAELIAIGASVAANCHPCVRYHVAQARTMRIDEAQIRGAIDVGKMVRKGAAEQMDKLVTTLAK